MPDELFFNSKVGVVSCIMIFTAHKPHSEFKETYFGYYKNDNFIKRKGKGRYDGLGLWEDTKKKWLSNFINKKDEAGFSVNKIVTADMEWVTEAYMETDYSSIENINFEDSILNYVTFLHKNKLVDKVDSNE